MFFYKHIEPQNSHINQKLTSAWSSGWSVRLVVGLDCLFLPLIYVKNKHMISFKS